MCPLTENGFVRVLSQPSYPNNVGRVSIAVRMLENMKSTHAGGHQFWDDSESLLDNAVFDASTITGPKQITDVYLLGLCQRNGGMLVTLDTRISLISIVAPRPDILRIL